MEIENAVINHDPGTVFIKVPLERWDALRVEEDTEIPIKDQDGATVGTATLHADGRVTGRLDDPVKVLGQSYGRTVALRGVSISTEELVIRNER